MKPRALEPAESDLELSVCRSHGKSDHVIWELADLYEAEASSSRKAKARAEFAGVSATKRGLRIVSKEPPKWHAVVVDWPAEKQARVSVAQEIAAESKLSLRPLG